MNIQKIASICAILAVLGGFYSWCETHYALAAEVEELKERLEFKIVEDKLDSVDSKLIKFALIEASHGELTVDQKEYKAILENHKTRLKAQYEALVSK